MKVGRASDNHTYSSPPLITPANAFRPQQKLQIYAHSASPIFATKHFPAKALKAQEKPPVSRKDAEYFFNQTQPDYWCSFC